MTVVFVGEFTGCIEFVKIYKWMLSESAKKKKLEKKLVCVLTGYKKFNCFMIPVDLLKSS